ncbi:T9SS type A sorting domain-containing protein [Constantimarinum furrinae]|uniref:Secretion system C-terminal sorting domain-containing protein n=1 Tax=Constantimarinum furrinae TaxID=2562285 RepID=A0A7G8PR56_9FLAO|nr:T9SS type A sorting domain-containing protein [Constantimarinum furrinae]QNJ96822.1 hypothetical protein ALE3EI_0232 [Constantimarinum furrinae]
MKKITLLIVALLVATVTNAQITLSQSVDPVTIDSPGVACWSSGTGEYRDNAFARTYDLNSFGITGDFEISAVEFGQSTADDGKSMDINIYTSDSEDLTTATLTLVGTTSQIVTSAGDNTLITTPLVQLIPAGSIVVVEVFGPDEGTTVNQRFFPGFNMAGENSTPWLKSNGTGTGGASTGCGIEWTDANTVVAGAPQPYVINLVGTEILGVGDNLSELVSIYPNPTTTVLNVDLPGNVEVLSAQLYDVLGKDTGLQLVNGAINTSNLSRGVYILNLKTDRGTLTQKVVKE